MKEKWINVGNNKDNIILKKISDLKTISIDEDSGLCLEFIYDDNIYIVFYDNNISGLFVENMDDVKSIVHNSKYLETIKNLLE